MIKTALVLGMGISGKAAADFLREEGYQVIAIDQMAKQVDPYQVLSDKEYIDLSKVSLFVPSPGISPNHPVYKKAKALGIPTYGELEIGLRASQCRLIGITGTNGKSTAVLLLKYVLSQAGFEAKALGNIGTPLAEEIKTLSASAVGVIEMSSYQLETAFQKALEVAAILNITEDHLERHGSYLEYAKAKFQILSLLKEEGEIFLPEQIITQFSNELSDYSFTPCIEKQIPAEIRALAFANLSLSDLYICYQIVKKFGIKLDEFIKAVNTFTPLPHRIQFVANVRGVLCYNDSKSTNVASTIHAVEKLPGHIILIAGGYDKGATYAPWKKHFVGRVKCVIALGQAKDRIQKELDGVLPIFQVSSLEEAIEKGLAVGQEGDRLLLSPGCSSFDMFKNYEERGNAFIRGIENES